MHHHEQETAHREGICLCMYTPVMTKKNEELCFFCQRLKCIIQTEKLHPCNHPLTPDVFASYMLHPFNRGGAKLYLSLMFSDVLALLWPKTPEGRVQSLGL